MSLRTGRTVVGSLLLVSGLLAAGCNGSGHGSASPSPDPELAKRGSIEVTAKLVEIPEGAIFERRAVQLRDRPEVRGARSPPREGQGRDHLRRPLQSVSSPDPKRPISACTDVGGNLKSFRAGDVHRMALEESMLDHFTGGILNLYSEEDTDPIYWAVWTDLVSG